MTSLTTSAKPFSQKRELPVQLVSFINKVKTRAKAIADKQGYTLVYVTHNIKPYGRTSGRILQGRYDKISYYNNDIIYVKDDRNITDITDRVVSSM